MFKDKKTLKRIVKLEQRMKSLEEELGITWYPASEYHETYLGYVKSKGVLHELYAGLEVNYVSTQLQSLLEYLKLTEVTYPEKTVIEPIKETK